MPIDRNVLVDPPLWAQYRARRILTKALREAVNGLSFGR